MNGLDSIITERLEQINKHQQTPATDAIHNSEEQLIDGMFLLIASLDESNYNAVKIPPKGWNEAIWHHMLQKDKKGKLAVIGAFASAEIDRLNYQQ